MKVSELLARLAECSPDAEVFVEQTNYEGPEGATDVVEYKDGTEVVIEGDLFK